MNIYTHHFNATDRLKKVLQKHYEDMVLDDDKRAPLNDVYVDLRLQEYDTEVLPETLTYRDVAAMEERMQEGQKVLLSELFDKMEDEVPPNILLLRGKAGVGKSTIVKRIASEWAAGKLWADVFSHVFVVTLKELLESKWTLSQLLLSGLPLSPTDHAAFSRYISQHSNSCLILADGLDEVRGFEFQPQRVPDHNASMELIMLLSDLVGNTLLPGAKVLVTSRPSQDLPVAAFDRTVEIYGFSRESIHNYVTIFSEGNEGLKQFIMKNLEENMNLMTLCYIPILCGFVCESLSGVHMQKSKVKVIVTMTQLYATATTNSAKKLHPRLKNETKDIDEEEVLKVVKEPYRKYAAMAKESMMTHPLRIVFYKDDLSRVGLDEGSADDMQCGVVTQSRKTDRRPGLHKRCWTFNHLTLQEYFSAIGLLEGSADEIMTLLQDKSSVIVHEVVLAFIMGLCGDEALARYRSQLLSREVTLDLRTLVEKLAKILEDDPLKLMTMLHETQHVSVVDVVPRRISQLQKSIFPAEMRALCWVLQQEGCPVNTLW